MRTSRHRAGDAVEVKSAVEILATLDPEGQVEALPFMPEMLDLCGKAFTVAGRAQKVCDTSHLTGSRGVPGTVLLDDPRCDGSAHGGCQAECRLFFKDEWLRPAGAGSRPDPQAEQAARTRLAALLGKNARRAPGEAQEEGWRCQATALHGASEQVKALDPRPYLREFTSGNVRLGRFLRVTARAAVEEPLSKLGLLPREALRGTRDPKAPPEPPLGLQPGELVKVKPREEILRAVTPKGTNRGLWFDREMLPYCGDERTFRVRRRVSRIIDERSGRMNLLKNDCITLEGVVCTGELVPGRFFCPRGYYPYWREAWLTRVEPPGGTGPA